jgi:hypothetical protein
MPSRLFASTEEMNNSFKEHGSKILAIVDKAGNEYSVDRVPYSKEKIKWTCANDKRHISISSLECVIRGNREKYICKRCAISKGRGGMTFEEFSEYLKNMGWKMNDKKKNYCNSKSLVNVVCPKGHETQTSQNRIFNGHGCAKCAADGMRKHSIEDIKQEFATKGFELLATTYKNNSELLDYKCKCGRIGKISYTNFTHNIDGCNSCSGR